MVVFPNAKINLGLEVHAKQSDGYHTISSCFYPIDSCDILEILPSKKLTFQSTGLSIPGNAKDNLCLKAHHLLAEDFGIPPVIIHLHKAIPIGAGLGGGSSDGTATLKALNEMFDLKLSSKQLEQYASQLGSDCPFFVKNQPALASGTGTTLTPINLELDDYIIILKQLNIHISTAEAYSGITPTPRQTSIEEHLKQPVEKWRDLLVNDFEKGVFLKHPEIGAVMEEMYKNGALYASMTGTGSCVYGIFSK